eukprot:NODE_3562_length_391_cov_413.081871_g3010_i0.p1 GENE.NODE_3562_length_391_cov_413.081871_g3010_i0~~NODE_3562_length_391_cov_413.081871_g3010_i0.p1  ORF type:complete len:98 (-),score=43.30 NODE_3562_length_391_cov_413.081871_g3010_i0:96-368(-)
MGAPAAEAAPPKRKLTKEEQAAQLERLAHGKEAAEAPAPAAASAEAVKPGKKLTKAEQDSVTERLSAAKPDEAAAGETSPPAPTDQRKSR